VGCVADEAGFFYDFLGGVDVASIESFEGLGGRRKRSG